MGSQGQGQSQAVPPAKKPVLSIEQIMAGVESRDYIGFCINCGNEQDGCEPDARKYLCDSCGQRKVYGAEELLMMFAWALWLSR